MKVPAVTRPANAGVVPNEAVMSALGSKVNSLGVVATTVKMVPGARGVPSAGTEAPADVVPVKFTLELDGMVTITFVPAGVSVSSLNVTVMRLKSGVGVQVVEPALVEGQRVKLNGIVVLELPEMRANGVTTLTLPELRATTGNAKFAVVPVTLVTSWGTLSS